jgi:hypothetical protein
VLDSNIKDVVIDKWWVTTDRHTLEAVKSSPEEFVDIFIENLTKPPTHESVANQQSVFTQETKYCFC